MSGVYGDFIEAFPELREPFEVWDKENASTVPGNYSLSVCIYNSHVISLSDSIIYIYIVGLTCVQMVEKLKGGESISFLYFPG